MIRVRNCTSRPLVRFLVGTVTNIATDARGWSTRAPGKCWHSTGGELGAMRGEMFTPK